MNRTNIEQKWWYRVFTVIFYWAYIYIAIGMIIASSFAYIEDGMKIWFLLIPLIFIAFEFIYWLFFYILLWDKAYIPSVIGAIVLLGTISGIDIAGNKINTLKTKKKMVKKKIWYSPIAFALIFLFICLPLILIMLFLNSTPEWELFVGFFWIILSLILIHSWAYRLKNAWKSPHLMWLLFIPWVNIILLGILFFNWSKKLEEWY